ncbi:HAMP domain-containing histidine kinase [Actinomyces sp. zg-332]|uniref:sensor histidine kinase n=1 Tax=Actinomyces sp. zg-332 TaxID=2708340 RepID=UPI00141D9976|nr:HAMP domain-containing sensor histidine kinase [Actinomyces sp. zg-332]QPK93878.1 HAMP domain-containing histidine kinase [Actinomyces sp. zg-332]
MRYKTLTMGLFIVVVVTIVLAIPSGIALSNYIVKKHSEYNHSNASEIAMRVDSLLNRNLSVDKRVFRQPSEDDSSKYSYVNVILPNLKTLTTGKDVPLNSGYVDRVASLNGALVTVKTLYYEANREILLMWIFIFIGVGVITLSAASAGLYLAHKLSVPLIYLAAHAEGIGSGGITSQLPKSGIEEIDLVEAELTRTAEKIVRRLAVERQFASNVSHQLRTPLTALSMRIEEIELITDDEEIKRETSQCLEQIERLTQVIQDLLNNAKNNDTSNQEAVFLFEIFDQQHKEWDLSFRKAKRDLIVIDETTNPVLATKGYISQVIATLIENSLKYGDGTTTVTAYNSGNKGAMIEVRDEGQGIDEKIADRVFEKHFSGHGSSGLGLSIAKDLVEADGARIELANLKPPVFRISLTTVSNKFMSDKEVSTGVMMGVGRRRRNLS